MLITKGKMNKIITIMNEIHLMLIRMDRMGIMKTG